MLPYGHPGCLEAVEEDRVGSYRLTPERGSGMKGRGWPREATRLSRLQTTRPTLAGVLGESGGAVGLAGVVGFVARPLGFIGPVVVAALFPRGAAPGISVGSIPFGATGAMGRLCPGLDMSSWLEESPSSSVEVGVASPSALSVLDICCPRTARPVGEGYALATLENRGTGLSEEVNLRAGYSSPGGRAGAIRDRSTRRRFLHRARRRGMGPDGYEPPSVTKASREPSCCVRRPTPLNQARGACPSAARPMPRP